MTETTLKRANHKRAAVRRKKQKRIQRRLLSLLLMAALITLIVLLCKNCSSANSVTGTWDYDTVTVYRFEKDGSGALVLPNDTYGFVYRTDGDKLYIDFENESARDSTYTFSVKRKTLTLVSEDGRTFVMKKVRK